MKQRKEFIVFVVTIIVSITLVGCNAQQAPTPVPQKATSTDNLKKAIDDIKGVLPKFAIPMREVGDRFANIYFAAKNGNWALAAYMSKYMNSAMNPAKLTKPNEYPAWSGFYKGTFDPVNKAIMSKNFVAFDKAYSSAIDSCNGCHNSMGYKFVKVVKASEPANKQLDYSVKSEPSDVPK